MTNKEYGMVNWKFEEVQKALGTDAKGTDFQKVWDTAELSKQTEILTKISNELLALESKKEVPHVVWTGEVRDEQNKINEALAAAFGEEPGYHEYVRLEDHTSWTRGSQIELQVNWSCIGAQSPDAAVAFAEALTEAANYAKTFHYNGFTETWD